MNQAVKKKKVFDGRYEILSIVGRGARSVVYSAIPIDSPETKVALKILMNKNGVISNSEILKKESAAMSAGAHKYVLRVNDFHSNKNLSYISMEYAPHLDLRKYLTEVSKLSTTQIKRFLFQISEAISHLHKKGIIHRDIKPENILVINERQVRLGDFGVAVLPGQESNIEELNKGVGTMDYMAPEVFEAKGAGKEADIYSLALTFYELFSGTHPFTDAHLADLLTIREQELTHLSEINKEVPKHISNAIMQALSYNLSDRFATAGQFYEALRNPNSNLLKKGKAPTNSSKKQEIVENQDFIEATKEIKPNKIKELKPLKVKESNKTNTKDFFKEEQTETKEINQNQADDFFNQEIDDTQEIKTQKKTTPKIKEEETVEMHEEDDFFNQTKDEKVTLDEIGDFEKGTKTNEAFENSQENQTNDFVLPQKESYERDNDFNLRIFLFSIPSKLKHLWFKNSNSGLNFFQNLNIKKIIKLGIIALLVMFAFSFFKGSKEKIATDNKPVINNNLLITFPQLANGLYSGEIQNVLPGLSAPLSIVSEDNKLIFLIGIDGYLPIEVNLSSLTPEDLESGVVKVASQGLILKIFANSQKGILEGEFKNLISKNVGKWQVIPSS